MSQHFLQSKYWKEVKEKLGNKIYEIKDSFFQTTKLPYIDNYVGYLPRADISHLDFELLFKKAKIAKCINIIIDPNNKRSEIDLKMLIDKLTKEGFSIEVNNNLTVHLLTTLVIDLTKSEEELLKEMKPKHRYNIKLAIKKQVEIKIDDQEDSFKTFLKLYKDTLHRQGYFGRSEHYLRTIWDTYKSHQDKEKKDLIKIATAYFQGEPIVSWMILLNEDTIYYPYGGSNEKYKNIMAPYALVWKIIQYGKEKRYKKLDLFGIREDLTDGYSRFKIGFGGSIVHYADTLTLIINKKLYYIYKIAFYIRKKFKFKQG